MNDITKTISNDINHIAKHANDLISATAGATEEKIISARNRLTDVLERGKEMYDHAKENVGARGMAADQMIREHLYPAIAIGIGAGLLVGYLASCRRSRRCD